MSMAYVPHKPQRLEIVKKGAPILTAVAKEVVNISDKDIQILIDDMIFTCSQEKNCIGLAAPQVGKSLRIIILATKTGRNAEALINPRLRIHPASNLKTEEEGCLSVPGVNKKVSRHTRIKVSFFDRTGQEREKTFRKLEARIIQHEIDHLNGKLIA